MSGVGSVRVISNCMMQAFASPTWAGAYSGAARNASSNTPRALGDATAFERFERRPPVDERTLRRQQRIERGIAFTHRGPRHGNHRSGIRGAVPSRCRETARTDAE